MDKRSDAIAEAESTKANAISVRETSFPYDGIFSPHGFLSTIPSTTSEDPGDDDDSSVSVNVDAQSEGQGQGPLPPMKKFKIERTSEKGTKIMPKNDLPPTQVAFGIDHIFEKILYSLENSDLLRCRVVCNRWCIVATAELQKTVELTFCGDILRMEPWNLEFDLRHLTQLLQQRSEVRRSRFPCQKFNFNTTVSARKNRRIRSTQLTSFLDIYGVHILSISIDCYLVPIDENVALTELRKLLTEQTPNLKNFSLSLQTSINRYKTKLIAEAYENKSLKTLCLNTTPEDSFKVLEGLLQLSPNLEELVHDDCSMDYQSYEFLKYRCFRKPLNRLHLLKYVELNPSLKVIYSLEKIVMASLDTPGTLKLRDLTVNSVSCREAQEYLDLERRFTSVFDHLFDCSSDTLENFAWLNATCIKGLELRKVMPKVKAFEIHVKSQDAQIFPPGLDLSTIFPSLRSIQILYYWDEADFIKFLNHLNPKKEILNSVKLVRVRETNDDRVVSTEALELLREFFPKADIQYPFQD